MDNTEERKDKISMRECVKTVASTAAGVSLGVVTGIVAITVVAAGEILLPVGLCLWSTGLAGGAFGLLVGINKSKKTS